MCREWTLRPGTRYDTSVLQRMIYEALYWQPEAEREPFDFVVAHDEISRYVDNWGRHGDCAVIAQLANGEGDIGAAWYRLFSADAPGYGFVCATVPEIAIAVEGQYRGRGIGRSMLEALVTRARLEGVPRLSLSVEIANTRAVRLYERLGFTPVGGDEHNHTMLLDVSCDAA